VSVPREPGEVFHMKSQALHENFKSSALAVKSQVGGQRVPVELAGACQACVISLLLLDMGRWSLRGRILLDNVQGRWRDSCVTTVPTRSVCVTAVPTRTVCVTSSVSTVPTTPTPERSPYALRCYTYSTRPSYSQCPVHGGPHCRPLLGPRGALQGGPCCTLRA